MKREIIRLVLSPAVRARRAKARARGQPSTTQLPFWLQRAGQPTEAPDAASLACKTLERMQTRGRI